MSVDTRIPAPKPAPAPPAVTARSGALPRPTPERTAVVLTLLAIAGISIYSLAKAEISVSNMLGSIDNAERFLARVGTVKFPPLAELLELTGLTLGLVLTGTLLAAALSVPVAYIAAANTTPGPAFQAVGRFITVFTRAIPDVVFAMVFILVFSIGALPGILAIGLHSIGMISKLFADAIEQIDEGPRLAIRASGGTKAQEFIGGVLPQVLPSWIATVLHRNDINLRGSVILGYVGVVGLGLEMSHAFKSLNYSLGVGIAIVMFILCVAMELVSGAIRKVLLGHTPDTSRSTAKRATARRATRAAAPLTAHSRRPWTMARVRNLAWGWGAVAAAVAGVWVCDIKWSDLLEVWPKLPAIMAQFWPPNFGSYDFATMASAMGKTLAIALAAVILSLVFSLVLGSFAARNVAPNDSVRTGSRLALVMVRGVPEIILAILLIVITGLGSQAGIIALAFAGVGLLGKLIADSLEEVQTGPQKALTATGATRFQTYVSATLPQGARAIIGHSFYLLDSNIRAATVLGIVGGGGIGYYLLNAGQGSNYQLVSSIVLMILVTGLAVEGIAMWVRKVLR